MSPRAPAAQAKLDQIEATLKDLQAETAILSLEEFEQKPGASKALAIHRSKIEAVERQAGELQSAVNLALRLDREAIANDAAKLRGEQLAVFKAAMAGREKAMAKALDALAIFVSSYAEFSEQTLAAAQAIPGGANAPLVNMGPNNVYGASWGTCERLLLAEMYRLAPLRKDGAGRFTVPFAPPPVHSNTDHTTLPSALDEFRKADAAVLAEIQRQVSELNQRAMIAAQKAA
jgi:hypothetical protein